MEISDTRRYNQNRTANTVSLQLQNKETKPRIMCSKCVFQKFYYRQFSSQIFRNKFPSFGGMILSGEREGGGAVRVSGGDFGIFTR